MSQQVGFAKCVIDVAKIFFKFNFRKVIDSWKIFEITSHLKTLKTSL